MSLDWSTVKSLSVLEGDVRAVSIGGVEVWRKLPYDAEVEYLESTGTQYIDTGVNGGSTVDVLLDFLRTTGAGIAWGTIYRLNSSSTATRCMLQCFEQGAQYGRFAFYTDTRTTPVWLTGIFNTRIATRGNLLSGVFSIGGQSQTRAVNAYSQPISIYILARNNSVDGVTSVGNICPAGYRIYGCQIRVSGTIVRDFIPVRVGSGANAVGYLYDKANPTGGPSGNGLYGNAGSGKFGVGPDAN